MPSPHEVYEQDGVSFLASLASPPSRVERFSDSPSFSRRDCRTRKSMELGRSSSMSQSLTQAKIERWSLSERIGELESQIWDLREVQRENAGLREELRQAKLENEDVVNRFSEMKDRVNRFIATEESNRLGIENELSIVTEQLQSVTFERDRVSQDSLRLKSEVTLLQQELTRARALIAGSVERSFHERMADELRSEVESVRKSFEGSVPQVVHERVLSQLQTVTSKLAELESAHFKIGQDIAKTALLMREKDDTIEKLQTQMGLLENRLEKSRLDFEAVQSHVKELAPLVDDGRKYPLITDALKESIRRAAELTAEIDRKAESEKAMVARFAALERDAREVARWKHSVSLQVKRMKAEFSRLQASATAIRSESDQIVRTGLRQVQEKFTMEIAPIYSDICDLLNKSGITPADWKQPRNSSEIKANLKAGLNAITKEMHHLQAQLEAAENESVHLKSDNVRKTAEIRNLSLEISTLSHERSREDKMLSRLRDSIESAELRIGRNGRVLD